MKKVAACWNGGPLVWTDEVLFLRLELRGARIVRAAERQGRHGNRTLAGVANISQLRIGPGRIEHAGDGASVQLAKAGFPLVGLQTLVLSHLHFDHTGGLFAVISERYRMLAPGVLTIYGPPGTQTMVSGLLEAMAPSPPLEPRPPSAAKSVKVIEVNDGSTFVIGAIKVTATRNTHYVATPGGAKYVSLSYRFDTPRVPSCSPAIQAPASRSRNSLAEPTCSSAKSSTRTRSTSRPNRGGLIAAHAGVKERVLTHDDIDPAQAPLMKPGIMANYKGPIIFAQDLDRF